MTIEINLDEQLKRHLNKEIPLQKKNIYFNTFYFELECTNLKVVMAKKLGNILQKVHL